MIQFVLKRLLKAIPTLLLMLTVIFVLVRLVPGDPAMAILGDMATEESLRALRDRLGLNEPMHVQYFTFVMNALTGDFGRSLMSGRTVWEEVAKVLPYTLELTASAIAIGAIFGIPLGTWAAIRRNAWPDYIGRLVSLTGLSFPGFVLGILMLLAFAVQLGWFPVMNSQATDLAQHFRNLALPALNLGLIMTAYIMRVTRSSMLNVLGEDYIRTARAKGVAPRGVVTHHALRNALVPVVTVVGLYFGTLIGNSVLVEIVFTRPGLGKLILGALTSRDYTLLQGLMIIFAALVIVVNILTDIAYTLVDPRGKLQ
ncbi:Glutathione transport system permease protein GsiC [Hyphomicrobiales bacterium]|nr:Glutathione transport system permease protein GsiC [Hyphomicrobiales bacterium]CAH1693183.1 Glutathione transport system permease protein GsiC [Hyphomicrobiales bacterium]